jgi:hypothetical protein
VRILRKAEKSARIWEKQGEFLIKGWEKGTMMCNNEAHTYDHFPPIILLTVL